MRLITISLLAISLCSEAYAQCPKHSWIVELHSKQRGISCNGAAQEIKNVFASVQSALRSGRAVEIENFGQFSVGSPSKSKSGKAKIKSKKLSFRTARSFQQMLNDS